MYAAKGRVACQYSTSLHGYMPQGRTQVGVNMRGSSHPRPPSSRQLHALCCSRLIRAGLCFVAAGEPIYPGMPHQGLFIASVDRLGWS